MKKTILILCLTLFSFHAQASFWDIVGAIGGAIIDSGKDRSRPDTYEPHRSRPTCTYRDQGHEEHRGGHRSCGDCLGKHGRCDEVCSVDFVQCKVEGRDYRGYAMNVEAKGSSSYEAERDALRRCDRNGWTECRRVSCSNQSETVSRRQCR